MAKKVKVEIPDGMSPKLKSQYSAGIRKVWMWSKMRRLAVKRAMGDDGFMYCEMCDQITPKAFVDHIKPCGDVLSPGFMKRLNVPSKGLQVLCNKCHREKTKAERAAKKS